MRIIASGVFPMPAKNILIIDDDVELAELLKSFMESEGFAEQRAARMDINDFLALLAAFNAKGIHFT